jgi:PAS domain S-box-containing protein
MKPTDVISNITQILILLTAAMTLLTWVRGRSWPQLDIHLMFAALGGLVLFGQLSAHGGARTPVLRLLGLLCFLLQPYLLLRLVLHVRPVGRWVRHSIGWSTAIVCASLFVAKRWPVPVRIEFLAFFIAAEGYGFAAFLGRAIRTRGAARWKCAFAALGTLSLALLFVAAGFGFIVPLSKDLRLYVNRVGSLVTALSYLVAFATPRFVQRRWHRAELHRFLMQSAGGRAPDNAVGLVEQLCEAAHAAAGGLSAVAAAWREETRDFAVCLPREGELTGLRLGLDAEPLRRAWESKLPVAIPVLPPAAGFDRLAALGAKAALVMPIVDGDWSWGVLVVVLRTRGLFVEEDLELLQLMAGETAHLVKVREVADLYAAMAEAAPFGEVIVSALGRVLEANPRTRELFGYPTRELIGSAASRLIPAADASDPAAAAVTLTGVRRDGSEFPVSLRRNSLTLEARPVTMWTIEDISARREAELAVHERTAQLEAANRELESFSYSVSHDLRAPLRAVDGFSMILEEDCAAELSPDARHYLGMVRQNTKQMGTLIDDLLAFSRLGRQPLQRSVVDMSELVVRVVEDVQRFDESRHVRLELEELPPCEADPSLLKQVMVNLVSNAFKFSRKAQEPRIAVGCNLNPAGPAEYYVRDNGVGFDMAYAAKLFGVFQRLHRAEDYEGTGVGLAIVHRIISRHGGRIWADSRIGEGATFFFTLN